MGVASDAAKLGNAIITKWRERAASSTSDHGRKGFFNRYLDGDYENDAPQNKVPVSPYQAFYSLHIGEEHADDWSEGLTEEEVSFVISHAWNFVCTYQKDEEEVELASAAPPEGMYDARLEEAMQEAMKHPEVSRLVADGDAAMEAGDHDRAVELYMAAKHVRNQLLPLNLGDAPGVASGSQSRLPQHGRRSTPTEAPNRTSIINSSPSRRKQPEGAPTRREEVAARIAARK